MVVTGSSEHYDHRPLIFNWTLLFSRISEMLGFKKKKKKKQSYRDLQFSPVLQLSVDTCKSPCSVHSMVTVRQRKVAMTIRDSLVPLPLAIRQLKRMDAKVEISPRGATLGEEKGRNWMAARRELEF